MLKTDAIPTVLVVDDEEMVRRLYCTALERKGYRVLTADNGLEGVACAEIERPDAILMDFQMPKLDGLEATRRLSALRDTASIPVIGLTGHATHASVVEMMRAGGTDVVVKSDVRVADLVRRIDQAIARSHHETKLRETAREAQAPPFAIGRAEPVRFDLNRRLELRALPFIAAEIGRLTQDPTSDAAVLAATIERDPSLTARVLQVANSAFFAHYGRIHGLTQAVTRIGFSDLRHLALAVKLVETYGKPSRDGGLDRIAFWRHSLGVALLARNLAAQVTDDPARHETVFLAGLLHDISKAVLDDNVHAAYGDVVAEAARDGVPLHAAETERFEMDHATIARRLLERWNFPPELVEPIALHHLPIDTPARDAAPVGWVRIADLLVKAAGIGGGGDATLEPVPDEFSRRLGLTHERVRAAMKDLVRGVDELTQILMLYHGESTAPPKPNAGRAALIRESAPIVDPIRVFLEAEGFKLVDGDADVTVVVGGAVEAPAGGRVVRIEEGVFSAPRLRDALVGKPANP